MGHARVVSLLAFVLCLITCLSASADGSNGQKQDIEVTVEQARQAVYRAKDSITKVNSTAVSKVSKAKVVLERVETLKRQAEKAKSQAEQALFQVEEAVKENEEAKTPVEKIKEISNTVSTSSQNSKDTVEKTNARLVAVLEEAEKLKTDCDKQEAAIKVESANYANIKTQASQIQNKADKLRNNITAASQIISGVQSTADNMEKSVKNVQVKTLHVSCILGVAEIDVMMGNTDIDILEKKNKKLKSMALLKKCKYSEKLPPVF